MTPFGCSTGSGRATLVAAYPTPQAARDAWRAIRSRHVVAVSVLWMCEPAAAHLRGATSSDALVIEGPLLELLGSERERARGPLDRIAPDLRRLGLLDSSLGHYASHLVEGNAVLVAHGVEREIEHVYRIVEHASLSVHHVALD